ncbi:S1 family peptidase [Nocardiopsis aegyptia]|uniref:S1 family peptidase n=1 Tax=Nocardiopsis aegyptia TaxID=220378 RepID=UPI00366D7506
MRSSVIPIAVVGAGALALGAALAVVPNAGGEPVPAETVADGQAMTMLDALEQDLGLTPFGAEELLRAQEEALAVEAEAAAAAGEAYGGSLFDAETRELTVLVTDPAYVEPVEAAGAGAEVVDHGADGLARVSRELGEAGPPDGVVGWYPDIASDTVVIEALEGTDTGPLVEAAGIDASAVRVEEVDERPETYADIVGGQAYFMGGGRCSVGFAVTDGAGAAGFVTAGHCGTAGTPAESGDGTGSGVFEESVFPGSDGAFVRATSNWNPTNLVEGADQAVTGAEQAPVGAAVCRSGSTTGWHCGTIEARGQTVTYPQGTVEGLTRTDVCAEPGDSGGSFVSGSQAQGVTSGGSGDCTSGGTTFYQEVGPLLSTWDLSLVTG